MRGRILLAFLLLGLLLMSGCVTLERLEANAYCEDWSYTQVQLGTYSYRIAAYAHCMRKLNHSATAYPRRNCGVSGLGCS